MEEGDAGERAVYAPAMLTHLSLRNFKSWAEAELAFGRITGLFGPNSSGKTALIQFLLLLKQTREATDSRTVLELNGPYARLGVYSDIIASHNDAKLLSWQLFYRPHKPPLVLNFLLNDSRDYTLLKLDCEVRADLCRIWTSRLSYRIGDVVVGVRAIDKDERSYELFSEGDVVRFAMMPDEIEDDDKFTSATVNSILTGRKVSEPKKSYLLPYKAKNSLVIIYFVPKLESSYELEIDGIFYLGPLRQPPERDYLWARSTPSDVGVRGERAVDALLAATAHNETRTLNKGDPPLPIQQIVAHWLREMGLVADFRVEELAPGSHRWQARLQVHKNGPEVLLTDVGFGISQVLPVITLLYYVPEGSTVILEQPELHLHPLAQSVLADVIISAAQNRDLQVLVESHSEHLLLRLQRRVAEEVIPADDVKLYFCEAPEGVSKLRPLELDEYGQIANWPDKFMGDAFGETFAAEEARLKRMQAGETA
ncbi:MAG: DUF3696 domain-containing protein [Gammaproteobacteria bacterium]|jgi:predicted ATPase|nr:DUF3696 domain-containing protein [Gammaproteobacteria bacterium]